MPTMREQCFIGCIRVTGPRQHTSCVNCFACIRASIDHTLHAHECTQSCINYLLNFAQLMIRTHDGVLVVVLSRDSALVEVQNTYNRCS